MDNPIIRVSIQGFEATIQQALADLANTHHEMLHASIAAQCTPERLQAVIDAEVKRCTDEAVIKAVQDFYRWGDGRKIVAKAVQEKLLSELTVPE